MKLYVFELMGAITLVINGWACAVQPRVSERPPYSNPNYSCRCLPTLEGELFRSTFKSSEIFDLHRSVCELRTYVREFEQHWTFLSGLLQGQCDDVSEWLLSQSEQTQKTLTDQLAKLAQSKIAARSDVFDIEQCSAAISKNKAYDAAIAQKLVVYQQKYSIPGLSWLFGVSTWLYQTGQSLIGQQDTVKQSVLELLEDFPFEVVASHCQSATIKNALEVLIKDHNIDALNACWSAISELASSETIEQFDTTFGKDLTNLSQTKKSLSESERRLWASFVAFKDLTNITFIMYNFLAYQSALYEDLTERSRDVGSNMAFAFEVWNLYDKINALPIEKTLDAVSDFVKKFVTMITCLQGEADSGLLGWLHSKWLKIPLCIGVVVIKIVRYFFFKPTTPAPTSTLPSIHPFINNKPDPKKEIKNNEVNNVVLCRQPGDILYV